MDYKRVLPPFYFAMKKKYYELLENSPSETAEIKSLREELLRIKAVAKALSSVPEPSYQSQPQRLVDESHSP